MSAPSPRRNGTAAGLRRLCLETGFTLLPIGLALLMADLLLRLMGVDPLAYYGFILRKGLPAPSGRQASLTRMGPLLLIAASLMMSFLGVSLANVLVELLLADPATTVPQTRTLPWEQRLPMLFGGQVSSSLLQAG